MPMIACPGCGLPREESLVNAVPCPVCDAGPSAVATSSRAATAKSAPPDPTANLPSDASQLHATPAVASSGAGFVGWVVVFALGVGVGVGGLLGWQAAFPPDGPKRDSNLDTAQVQQPGPKVPAKSGVAVAPMPHEPSPRTADSNPEPTPDPPKVPKVTPPPERAVVVPLDDPAAVHTVPSLKKGERLVLRGKVKTLRIEGLDAGAILDASALQVQNVFVSGKIDSRSTLKVNAPDGVVLVAGAINGQSAVEIHAPGGEVKFSRSGNAIDGGSTVTVAGRNVELRGDVNGIETKVTVNIPGTGSLKVAAVRGIARVEYRVAGEGTPEVVAGVVSPTATFQKID
jgi:hypothetical protein